MSSIKTLIQVVYQGHANGLCKIHIISIGGIVTAMIFCGYQLTLAVENLFWPNHLSMTTSEHLVQLCQFVTFSSRTMVIRTILLQHYVPYFISSLASSQICYGMLCRRGKGMGTSSSKRLLNFGGSL
jgi:hypothetical protein